MKILITGSKGQLGKKLNEILSSKHELLLTDSDNMDITNFELVKEIVKKEKPDFIIHAAAYTNVDKAEDEIEICRKINSLGTKNIALASKESNAKLIYVSTDYVFDGKKNIPYTEEDIPNPISVYGLTKYEGEESIKQLCKEYYIIRVSWLFGELPKEHKGKNFVEKMLDLSKTNKNLNLINDQIGSPTYTGDLAEVILKIIEKTPILGIYHFSGNGECSWYNFAKAIFKQKNINVNLKPIQTKEFPQKAKRPIYSYLDKTKIEKALNIKVRSWQEMLKTYLFNK